MVGQDMSMTIESLYDIIEMESNVPSTCVCILVTAPIADQGDSSVLVSCISHLQEEDVGRYLYWYYHGNQSYLVSNGV